MTSEQTGIFHGVGVGPGDPELITRKAERILREADRILTPAGASGDGDGDGSSFARRIIEPLGLDPAKFRRITMCMSRNRGDADRAYTEAADTVAAEVRAGRRVVWITEGDPLFYSTFVHLYKRLRQRWPDVPTRIVPGVCSTQAAAAAAQGPTTRLDERVAVVPAAYGTDRLGELLDAFATVFLIKAHRAVDRLADRLAELPHPVEAVYLEKIGTDEERIVRDLDQLRGKTLPYFSIVMLRRRSSTDPAADSTATAAGETAGQEGAAP